MSRTARPGKFYFLFLMRLIFLPTDVSTDVESTKCICLVELPSLTQFTIPAPPLSNVFVNALVTILAMIQWSPRYHKMMNNTIKIHWMIINHLLACRMTTVNGECQNEHWITSITQPIYHPVNSCLYGCCCTMYIEDDAMNIQIPQFKLWSIYDESKLQYNCMRTNANREWSPTHLPHELENSVAMNNEVHHWHNSCDYSISVRLSTTPQCYPQVIPQKSNISDI